jgi:Flp pilus assembly protein TadG
MADEKQGPEPERVSPTAVTEPNPPVAWPAAITSARRRETLSTPTIVAIILLATALIAGGLGLVVYATTLQYRASLHNAASAVARSTAQAQATTRAQLQGTANAYATANSNIYASATVQAGATATVVAQTGDLTATVTALGDILSQASSGTAALDDPLSDNTSNNKWDVTSGSVASGCVFIESTYRAIEARKGFFQACVAQSSNFSNFAYQVQMTIIRGGQGGIIFRANTVTGSFYLFRIDSSGFYALDLYHNNKLASTLVSGYSAAINGASQQANTLAVVAYKGTLYLFDNASYITSASDDSLSSGKIGVAALDYTLPTEAEFSSVQVWKVTAATFTTTPTPSASPTASPTASSANTP